MAEDELKAAKKTQRNAKPTFTRCGNWLTNIVDVKSPESEVRDALSKVEEAHNDLVVKHENYTTLIDDDAEYEEAEIWMKEYQGSFMNYVMQAKMYLDSLVSPEKQTLQNGEDKEKTASSQTSMIGISNMQSEGDVVSSGSFHDNEQVSIVHAVQDNMQHLPRSGDNEGVNDNVQVPNPGLNNPSPPSNAFGFKMEKLKLPKFAGDVREYAIFKADFKHAIKAGYTKRDSITFLHT